MWKLHPARWGQSYAVTRRIAAPAAAVVNAHTLTHAGFVREHKLSP